MANLYFEGAGNRMPQKTLRRKSERPWAAFHKFGAGDRSVALVDRHTAATI
jgi:hypothetical protein